MRKDIDRRRNFWLGLAAGATFLFCQSGANAGDYVPFDSGAEPGSIVINAHERKLYYVLGGGSAIAYRVAVPKAGKEWSGETTVEAKHVAPDWIAPEDVKRDHPELPDMIPGGSPRNPMGARAITLGQAQVAIHGTTNKMRKSIGSAASYGCIRMLDEDIVDLYDRVGVGAPVVMNP